MADEIGEIDLTAQANAAKVASNYISADSTGIRIANASPATATTYQHQTATETEFVVDGVSRASISGDGARFGRAYVDGVTDNESHLELDYHSLQLIDKDGNTYFHVSDLRGTDGTAEVVDEFVGDGSTYYFELSFDAADTSYTVVVSDGSGGTVHKKPFLVEFDMPPSEGATITATYTTKSTRAKAYTLGTRSTGNVGSMSVAEGERVIASGITSHAEGGYTTASGHSSHAEGDYSIASGLSSHAEGWITTASGGYSHAEGWRSKASGEYSHAEGYQTTASKDCTHAEGNETIASGHYSHAEGSNTTTTASANYAHAQNRGTIAAKYGQTTMGSYNIEDDAESTTHPSGNINYGTHALIIGNGTSNNARSNALTVDWDGNIMAQAMAGIIQMFAGSTAPTGWLECDGSAVSREDYATLFAAIGTTWGAGDGSTTFNLPDLRGRGPIGAGAGSGLTSRTLGGRGGSENIQAHTHGFTNPKIPNHVHTMAHTHPTGSGKNRLIGYLYDANGSGGVSSGVGKVRVTAASSGTNYVPRVANADVDFSGVANTGSSSAANTGNPTSLGNTTGGAVGAVSGATTGTSGNMQPFAVVKFIICTGKTS